MSHRAAIQALIDLRGTVDDAIADASAFPSVVLTPPVTLTCASVGSVLDRYLGGELTASDLERWADALEGRDDVEYHLGREVVVADVLFRLSSPAINEPLSMAVVRALRDGLGDL